MGSMLASRDCKPRRALRPSGEGASGAFARFGALRGEELPRSRRSSIRLRRCDSAGS